MRGERAQLKTLSATEDVGNMAWLATCLLATLLPVKLLLFFYWVNEGGTNV